MSRTQQPKDSIHRLASWTDQDLYVQDDGSILLWHVVFQTWVRVVLDEPNNNITVVREGGESGVPPPEAEAVPAPPAEPTPEPAAEPTTAPDVDERGPEV